MAADLTSSPQASAAPPAAGYRASTAARSATSVVEMERPRMGAEDFGVHLAAIPGAFALLGARPHTGDPYPWHHVQCVFDGRALVVGVSVRTSVTVGYLAPGRAAPAPD